MKKKDFIQKESQVYTVGATARLTGVSASTIRNWERRHGAIEPQRTPHGQRRFSSEDVQRLKTLARLTQAGHAIGALARLPDTELRRLEEEVNGSALPVRGAVSDRLQVIAVGARAGAHVQALSDSHSALGLVRQFTHADDLLREEGELSCDILVVHTAQISPATAEWLHALRLRVRPVHVVLVYEFARLEDARRLRDGSTSVLQGFGHLEQFIRVWLPLHAAPKLLQRSVASERSQGGGMEAGERQYASKELSRLQHAETGGLLCDCQRHLARMLQEIYDFEDYTDQCADLTEQDRQAHQEIRARMLHARKQVEASLRVACEHAVHAHGNETTTVEDEDHVEAECR